MIKKYTQIPSRFLLKDKKRTLLNILGVILATALICGTGTIIESIKQQMINSAIKNNGDFHVCYKNITNDQAYIISNNINVEASCRGKIEGFGVIAENENDIDRYHFLRLSSNDENAMQMLQLEKKIVEGTLPSKAGEIALDEKASIILGNIEIGSTLSLPVGNRRRVSDNTIITNYFYPLTIIDNEEDTDEYFEVTSTEQYIVTGFISEEYYNSANQSMSAIIFRDWSNPNSDETFNTLVKLSNLKNIESKAEEIASLAEVNIDSIIYNKELLDYSGKSMNSAIRSTMSGFNIIIVLIIMIATIAVIYNSFNISLIERVSQFGVLRCIGTTPKQIRSIIIREATAICLLGIPIGIVFGLFAMKVVFFAADSLSSNILFENLRVAISPMVILSSSIICLFTVYISALLPAVKAGNIPAIEAVRSTGQYNNEKLKSRRGKKRYSTNNFALQMAFRNINRNRKRFFVTLFSMIISVVLYVSFGGMLGLVKDSYLISDVEYPEFIIESEHEIEESVYNQLLNIDAIEKIYRYNSYPSEFLMTESDLSSYYKEYNDTYRNYEQVGPLLKIPNCRILSYGDNSFQEFDEYVSDGTIDINEMNRSGSVIIIRQSKMYDDNGNRSYLPNNNLLPGDNITIVVDEKQIDLKIAAIMDKVYYENFNPDDNGIDIIVTEQQFLQFTSKNFYSQLFIKKKAGFSSIEIINYLEELVVVNSDYSYQDIEQAIKDVKKETQAISIFFYGFIFVIALIGCLNILNTISTNLLIRSREIGIIQAVGLDQYGLRRMIICESIIYCIISLFIGSLIGTILWFFMVKNLSNIVITLFQVPWKEIVFSSLALFFITLISSYIPLKRVSKKTIVSNIRME